MEESERTGTRMKAQKRKRPCLYEKRSHHCYYHDYLEELCRCRERYERVVCLSEDLTQTKDKGEGDALASAISVGVRHAFEQISMTFQKSRNAICRSSNVHQTRRTHSSSRQCGRSKFFEFHFHHPTSQIQLAPHRFQTFQTNTSDAKTVRLNERLQCPSKVQ